MTELRADVVVVGAGPAGAVHAARLAAAGHRVIVVARDGTPPVGTFELLSGATAEGLREVNLLQPIMRRAPRCAGTVFRWADARFREQSGRSWLGGWIVDRAWLDPLLEHHIVASGATRVPASVTEVVPSESGVLVRCRTTRDGKDLVVHAGRVVIATGRTGRLAARAGAHQRVRRSMVAITTSRVGPFPRLGPRLLVDAATDGWWYALGDGVTATIGYVTDTDLLPKRPGRLAAAWRAALPSWVPDWARTVRLRGRPAGVASCVAWPANITMLGDAALALDPLSGHGLTLGIAGALRAVDDPGGYQDWLAAQRTAHERDERVLYAAARRTESEFWRRRTDTAEATSRTAC